MGDDPGTGDDPPEGQRTADLDVGGGRTPIVPAVGETMGRGLDSGGGSVAGAARPPFDLSSLYVDPGAREAPAMDPKRSRLLSWLQLGGAAAQLAGAVAGGDVGTGLASAGQGAAAGAGAVAAADRALFEREQEAHRAWLEDAGRWNRQLELTEARAAYDAQTDDYRDAREAEQERQRYARDRRDAVADRDAGWAREDATAERDQQWSVDDREDRQRETRERDARQAAQRRQERDARFAQDQALVRLRARLNPSRSATDPAGASAAIQDLDEEMEEVRAALRQAPAGMAGRSERERLEGRLEDLRKERRDRMARLRDPGSLAQDEDGQAIDAYYDQDPEAGPTYADTLDATEAWEAGLLSAEEMREIHEAYRQSPNSRLPRPQHAR
ncbi:MAG TPA: hypothetical protein EYQ24_02420 [Bacteroidetes bacterium]|nr:hypothetical protein [Bacteroidota bacterium]HIL59005.1 hypothetical protein [Rhodothermales bacterium]